MLIDNIISQANVEKQAYRIILCKMNREVIREITKQSYGKTYSPQLGGANAFSFSIPKEYDGIPVQNYDDIVGKNLILLKQGDTDIGYFEIQNPSISNDGVSEVKNINTLSAEVKLIRKKIYLTSGVFKLQNDGNPQTGLLNIITSLAPSWNIGYIDFSLINKQRYFDITESNVYELLLNQVQDTFECVIIFNTIDKTINAYALENFGDDSRINLSLNNVLEQATRSEMSEDIITRLHLYGGNDLTVRDINFGNTFVQNFGYFKNTRFMSQNLITALNNYETLVNNNKTIYSGYLSTLQTLNSQLITYNADLLTLNGELTSLLEQRSYLQSFGQSTTSLNTQINNKYIQIATKTSQINSTQSSINSVNSNIDSLLTTLNLANNFTQAQIEELDQFVIEDTYQDSAFLITDSMTYNEQIAIQQQLLDSGINVLSRVSYPRYKIEIDVVDFLKLTEYASWWGELNIGDIVRLDVGDFVVNVRVTGYVHDEDDNKLSISLGDRYQLDDANFQLLELIKSSISAGTTIDYKKYQIEDYSNNGKNQILSFINNSIDVAKNAIVSGTGVGVDIDTTGILATAKDPNTGLVMPQQLRISNNALVITNDGFNTAGLAIGIGADGNMHVLADVIAGKMILGNNMIIETGNGDFRVDGSGVNITKMALNLTSADNLKNILLDPSIGFKIRSRANTSQAFTDKFYVDSAGVVNFNGKLVAATGTFSGALSAASGTFTGTVQAGSIIGSTFSGGEITIGTNAFVRIFNDTGLQSGIIEFSEGTYKSYIVQDGSTLSINSSNRIFLAAPEIFFGGMSTINFNILPRVGGDFLATRNWVNDQIDDISGGISAIFGSYGITASYSSTTAFIGVDEDDVVTSQYGQEVKVGYLSGSNRVEIFVNGSYRGSFALE